MDERETKRSMRSCHIPCSTCHQGLTSFFICSDDTLTPIGSASDDVRSVPSELEHGHYTVMHCDSAQSSQVASRRTAPIADMEILKILPVRW